MHLPRAAIFKPQFRDLAQIIDLIADIVFFSTPVHDRAGRLRDQLQESLGESQGLPGGPVGSPINAMPQATVVGVAQPAGAPPPYAGRARGARGHAPPGAGWRGAARAGPAPPSSSLLPAALHLVRGARAEAPGRPGRGASCPVHMRYKVLNHVAPGSGWDHYVCCQGYTGSCCCFHPGACCEDAADLHIIDPIADIVFFSTAGCMTAQTNFEVVYRSRSGRRALARRVAVASRRGGHQAGALAEPATMTGERSDGGLFAMTTSFDSRRQTRAAYASRRRGGELASSCTRRVDPGHLGDGEVHDQALSGRAGSENDLDYTIKLHWFDIGMEEGVDANRSPYGEVAEAWSSAPRRGGAWPRRCVRFAVLEHVYDLAMEKRKALSDADRRDAERDGRRLQADQDAAAYDKVIQFYNASHDRIRRPEADGGPLYNQRRIQTWHTPLEGRLKAYVFDELKRLMEDWAPTTAPLKGTSATACAPTSAARTSTSTSTPRTRTS
ncbi:hypothetical protein JL722_2156 [Aureococcus anophagefferens]|nr:hypothetical protein JL722_2156 [Aureococcus anophagefferens]